MLPSLRTDSSEASKDSREASDGRSDVAASGAPATALCLLLVARARCGAAAH